MQVIYRHGDKSPSSKSPHNMHFIHTTADEIFWNNIFWLSVSATTLIAARIMAITWIQFQQSRELEARKRLADMD